MMTACEMERCPDVIRGNLRRLVLRRRTADAVVEVDSFQRRNSSKIADEAGYLAGLENFCFDAALGPHAAEGINKQEVVGGADAGRALPPDHWRCPDSHSLELADVHQRPTYLRTRHFCGHLW